MKTAYIYARFSSHNQTEQSIEGQVHVCTEWAEKNGYCIIRTYADRAISGKTDQRPQFLEMISDAVREKPNAVIVYKTDRFSRDRYDAAVYKQRLKKAGVDIKYAAEAYVEGPENIILESLMEGLAEYYSAELSQKIKRGLRESALKAKVTGSVPYGYVVSADKTYAIDPIKSEVVKHIFQEYVAGKTGAEIARQLNQEGYKTAHGKSWQYTAIICILSNEKYMGTYYYRDVRFENRLPKIIDEKTFYLAQEEIKRRAASRIRHKPCDNYLLSDKLFCGECGRKMHGVSGTSENGSVYRYYLCPNKKKKVCSKHQVRADYLERLVIQETKMNVLDKEHVRIIAAKVCEYQSQQKDDNFELKNVKSQLKNVEKSLSNCITAIEAGAISDALLNRLHELEQAKAELEQKLRVLSFAKTDLTEKQIVDYLSMAIGDEKIVSSLISRIELHEYEVVIYYNLSGPDGSMEYLKAEFDPVQVSSTKGQNGRTLAISDSAIRMSIEIKKRRA